MPDCACDKILTGHIFNAGDSAGYGHYHIRAVPISAYACALERGCGLDQY